MEIDMPRSRLIASTGVTFTAVFALSCAPPPSVGSGPDGTLRYSVRAGEDTPIVARTIPGAACRLMADGFPDDSQTLAVRSDGNEIVRFGLSPDGSARPWTHLQLNCVDAT